MSYVICKGNFLQPYGSHIKIYCGLHWPINNVHCTGLLASGAARSNVNTDRIQVTARMKCAVFVWVIGLTLIAGKRLDVCNACERRLWHVALSLARECK